MRTSFIGFNFCKLSTTSLSVSRFRQSWCLLIHTEKPNWWGVAFCVFCSDEMILLSNRAIVDYIYSVVFFFPGNLFELLWELHQWTHKIKFNRSGLRQDLDSLAACTSELKWNLFFSLNPPFCLLLLLMLESVVWFHVMRNKLTFLANIKKCYLMMVESKRWWINT